MKILVTPADGIGPEIVSAAENVLTAANEKFSLGLKLDTILAGSRAWRNLGSPSAQSFWKRLKISMA